MKVLIVGCGKVGSSLASQLCIEGHSVTVLDNDPTHLTDITNAYDIMGVVGDGTSNTALLEAGAAEADLLCAVTDSDEKNLLCCLIVRQLSHCRLVARVRNPIYNSEIPFFRESFDLAMVINPELAAAAEMSRMFRFPSAITIDTFAKGHVELLEFRVPKNCPLNGLSLADIRNRYRHEVLICVAEREGKVTIPSGDYVVQAGDILSLVAAPREAARFFKMIGFNADPVNSVMIVGGGTITYYLAKLLLSTGIKVKIIEHSHQRCDDLADKLPEAQIIFGDGTDEQLLREEGIGEVRGFAALTGIDEENILLSLYARSQSRVNAKVVTKINRITFNQVIDQMDLDSIINPKTLTAEYLLQYIRSMDASESSVENLYRLADGRVEALEFSIREESAVTGKSLQELTIRSGILIGKIYRHGQLITPHGQTEILPGDAVVVIAMAEDHLSRIDDILER